MNVELKEAEKEIVASVDNDDACDWENMNGDRGFAAALYDFNLLKTFNNDLLLNDIFSHLDMDEDDAEEIMNWDKEPEILTDEYGIQVTLYLK
jgi:hypothetical protein